MASACREVRAFGAEEGGRSVGPDGKIMHAEINIGDSKLNMNDVMPAADRALLAVLCRPHLYGVDCIVIGSEAVASHGVPRFSVDFDVFVSSDAGPERLLTKR